jgi:hypothetical protein
MSTSFTRGGQRGWHHGHGHPAGSFHTYDGLAIGGQARPVHLLLPPDYADEGGGHPLLVMHDGDAVFWPGGAFHKSWQVPGVLAALRGQIRQPIVVAVPPIDRAREYTHVDWAAGTRPWGGLAAYTAWLADFLVPWVREHYHVTTGPVAVAGASHGGLAALYNVVARPDVFHAAGAMSPSVWVEVDGWEHAQDALPLREGSLLRLAEPVLRGPGRPVLWLCWGLVRTGGFHNARTEALATIRGRELAELCVAWGYRRQDLAAGIAPDPAADLFVWEDPAGAHEEEAWTRRLPGMLRAFFGA